MATSTVTQSAGFPRLKQIVRHSFVVAVVLLIGVGTEAAIAAMVLYLMAHALYKAGLFLVAGLIDHGTGYRQYEKSHNRKDNG